MSGTQILVVKDESIVAEAMCRHLKSSGYVPLATASSGEEAV
jgi:CheY-like chemotaxis protein